MSIAEWLYNYGYASDDAKAIAEAHAAGGIEAAVAVINDYDDAEHDYTGELRECIQQAVRELP